MDFYDTFDETGLFLSSEDEYDVHYKGLWHKVIRVWLYDKEGNIYLRQIKNKKKCDCINELHMLSSESAASCFDRGMFEKIGIHFPATSDLIQVSTKKIKKHRVYSDNSETNDNYLVRDIVEQTEVLIKYEGYIVRQNEQILNLEKTEKIKIPDNIDYDSIKQLSTESKEKLNKIRPKTIGQALRIGGVKPADISVLMVLIEQHRALAKK